MGLYVCVGMDMGWEIRGSFVCVSMCIRWEIRGSVFSWPRRPSSQVTCGED